MSVVKFIEPTPDHIQFIADNMREADRIEVMASHGHTPMEALQAGLKRTGFTTIVTVNDEPCVMFGLVRLDLLSCEGTPWLLGTENALKYRREFLIQTPKVIAEMLTICPKLVNYVHSKNTVSIRWLRKLGFILEEPVPYGVAGELFHRFHLEKENV